MIINSKKTLPYPDPANFRDLRAWAVELTKRFQQDSVSGLLQKDPVLLPHQVDSVLSRATEDGLLMYDPVADAPVVSVAGVWRPLRLDDSARFLSGVATVTGTGTLNVVFASAAASVPKVLLTPVGSATANETKVANVRAITTAGFAIDLRVVDSAFSTPVRIASGDVHWLAYIN